MKIIQIHNYYQQAGGEDAVVAAERAMLEEHGNVVIPFYKSNDDIFRGQRSAINGQPDSSQFSVFRLLFSVAGHLSSVVSLLRVSAQTIWSRATYREFLKLLRTEKPDVVHCHNTFPLISPSIYWACAKETVPVVQTLHNYRLLCLNAFLFRQSNQSLKVKMPLSERLVQDVQIGRNEPLASLSAVVSNGEGGNDFNDGFQGAVCELCLKRTLKLPGIRYKCYRDSYAASLVAAAMSFIHKLIGTWSEKVTGYIALTEFQKQKMIEGGLPGQKIWVKPNFLQRLEVGSQMSAGGEQQAEGGGQKAGGNALTADFSEHCEDPDTSGGSLISDKKPYCLFVGRLSPEKGCDVLIRAWHLFEQKLISDLCPPAVAEAMADRPTSANNQKPQLLIVGDGPEREALGKLTSDLGPLTSVHFLGKQPKGSVLHLMRNAQFLVLPSLWYEGFPMTIVEAFSNGLSVVASKIGSMTSVIENRRNGLFFNVGDDSDLSEKLERMLAHPAECAVMGRAARQEYEEKYTAEANYEMLLAIYRQAIADRF
jgi:glycosyltransferase involved in cell wall biosynthesis